MCVCVHVCAGLNLSKCTVIYTEVWPYFQVDLTEPILSRFDVLCVVRDTVDPVEVGGSIQQWAGPLYGMHGACTDAHNRMGQQYHYMRTYVRTYRE